jgi:TonB-dependent receptor
MLERFEVSAERIGQARAIQEQRAAVNAKIVIATDNFGELTQGSMGEFLKYMPGVTLDYSEVEANGVRIGGLDPKYTGFSSDGIPLATAQGGGSRALDISSVSITGIEAIEFNQTLTASMDPGSAAGNINLKSKYSFNIRKNTFRYQIGIDGSSDAFDFGRDYMPDDKLHRRIFPGGMLNYGGTFLNKRLGVEVSVSDYTSYTLQTYNQVRYSYYTGDLPDYLVTSPRIAEITWRPGPKIYERTAANLSLDFKITPKLIVSLHGNYSKNEGEYFNLYTNLSAYDISSSANGYGPSVSVQPESILTRWVVTPTNTTSTNSRLFSGYSRHRSKSTNNLFTPRIEYKNGPLSITFRGAYTKARALTLGADEYMFRATSTIMSGIGFTAERPDEGSPVWTLTQTDGLDWRVPQNWSRVGTYNLALNTHPVDITENEQFSGYLDVTYARRVFGQPVTFKTGGGVRHNDYSYTSSDDRYNYLGPTSRQLEGIVPWTQNYIFDYKYGNISEQNWRADSEYELGRIFMAHPEWFQENTIGNYARSLLLSRDASENIKAAYVEAISRYKAWQFNLGVRYETTTTKAQVTRMRPSEDIAAARELATQEQRDSGMFDETASIAGINFKYYNGERVTRERDYGNIFLSGGFKYDITKNLRFQLSASQSILRPNYANIAGVISFYSSAYTTDIWVPNPILKPERATKYYAGLKYYLNPAGSVGISVYRFDIRDKQINGMQITPEQAEEQLGYPLRDAIDLVRPDTGSGGSGGGIDESGDDNNDVNVTYTPITYRSTINVPGNRTVYGVTFDYDQQLLFLPGFLKGLGIFGSYTWSDMQNAREDEELIGLISNSANGGIKYRYKRFNVQLRASWQGDQLKSVTRPIPNRDWILDDHVYQKSRIIWDLSGGFNLGRDIDLVFSIRNVFNAPQIYYSNERSRMRNYFDTGAICSVSLKGSF